MKEAVPHLKAFLADPPTGAAATQHIAHAEATLAQLTGLHNDATTDSDTE
jgi:hypothetical protein